LDVKTGKSGTQGLIGTLTYQESGIGVSRREREPISENALRAFMLMPGELFVEVRTTSGKPITLGRNEIMALLS
jgi:hypothetical protein